MSGQLTAIRFSHLPDLDTQKYASIYGNEVRDTVMERHDKFLGLISDISGSGDLTVSLRYYYDPSYDGVNEENLRIYLFVNNETGLPDEKVQSIVYSSPLSEFYDFRPEDREDAQRIPVRENGKEVDLMGESKASTTSERNDIREMLDLDWVDHTSHILRKEEFFSSPDDEGEPYYCIHPLEPDESNRMVSLERQLNQFDRKTLIDLTIRPVQLDATMREGIQEAIRIYENQNDYDFTAEEDHEEDIAARKCQDKFEDIYEQAITEKLFHTDLRVLSEDGDYGSLLSSGLALASTREQSYQLVETQRSQTEDGKFQDTIQATRNLDIATEVRNDKFWKDVTKKRQNFRSLPRLFTISELNPFFRLIIPGKEIFNSIYRETDAQTKIVEKNKDEREETLITVAQDWHRPDNDIKISLDDLKKHMFVTGVTGCGKTQDIQNMLIELWDHDIPFMVIEPAKTEYRSLKSLKQLEDGPAKQLAEDLQIYTLGNERVSPFRFNPFEFIPGTPLNQHLGCLETSFNGALPLWTPLPELFTEALDRVYRKKGWDEGTEVYTEDKPVPDIQDFREAFHNVFDEKEYAGEVSGNLKTAGDVRLGSLTRRSIGLILDTTTSIPRFDELMEQPVIIEMDALNEVQSNLMTLFLLSMMREYIQANRQSGDDLQHCLVLEEAHNLVGKTSDTPTDQETADPKAEATKFVARFLAEVRALGEGLIIADQIPAAMAPEVVKNTNIKVAHRLVSQDDREMMGSSMVCDQSIFDDMPRLSPGEAYMYKEGMHKAVKVQMDYPPEKHGYAGQPELQDPPDHDSLRSILAREDWFQIHQEMIKKGEYEQKLKRVRGKLRSIWSGISSKINNLKSSLKNFRRRFEDLSDELDLRAKSQSELTEKEQRKIGHLIEDVRQARDSCQEEYYDHVDETDSLLRRIQLDFWPPSVLTKGYMESVNDISCRSSKKIQCDRMYKLVISQADQKTTEYGSHFNKLYQEFNELYQRIETDIEV